MANIRKDGFVSHVNESIKNGSYSEIFDVKKSQLAEGLSTEAMNAGLRRWKNKNGFSYETEIQKLLAELAKNHFRPYSNESPNGYLRNEMQTLYASLMIN